MRLVIPRYRRESSFSTFLKSIAASATGAENPIPDCFPGEFRYATRSGREALLLILQALGLRPGSVVGVPIYCCAAVFEAVVAAGHRPFFLEVDEKNLTSGAEQVATAKANLDALILIHTFGYPINVNDVRSALPSGVPVIEDCAHATYSRVGSQLVGTVGDASFFSTGVHKPVSTGSGGIAVTGDPALARKLTMLYESLPKDSRLAEWKDAAGAFIRSLGYTRLGYTTVMRAPQYRKTLAEGIGKAATRVDTWHPHKIRLSSSAVIARAAERFKESLRTVAQNADYLRGELVGSDCLIPEEPITGTWNHFLLPAIFPTIEAAENARAKALASGVDIGLLYPNCLNQARNFGYEGARPRNDILFRTFLLPHYAELSNSDLERVASALTSVV